jgi:DNA-binding PadR family transcriptional regulator
MAMPQRERPLLTDEEGAVLGVLLHDSPGNVWELKQLVDRRFGSLLSLDTHELHAILKRLEARGLIAKGGRGTS